MQKRKRTSLSMTTPSKKQPAPSSRLTRQATDKSNPSTHHRNGGEEAGQIESVEIDLTTEDDAESFNMEGQGVSLPKKKKMDESIKGRSYATRASDINVKAIIPPNAPPPSSTKNGGNKSDDDFLTAESSHANGNGNGGFATPPETAPPHTFKVPGFPVTRGKKLEVPPSGSVPVPRLSSLVGIMETTTVKQKKKKRLPSEREIKATTETRKLRVAIAGAFEEELEKATNDEFDDINIDDLVGNLQTCIKMWPNIYVRRRYPQVEESDDRSHKSEIMEFARWWFFGLTGLLFASPAMNKPDAREEIKQLIRTLCQLLFNGHPVLINSLFPQLLGVLRDLTVPIEAGSTPTIKIHLFKTKVGEDNKKTKITCNFKVKITEKNEWVIPHYLETISILFPRIFFYDFQHKYILVELLKRLSNRLPPASYAPVMISTLHNALMPSSGYLIDKAAAEMIYEMVKVSCSSEVHWNEIQKMFNHCEIGSLSALASYSGPAVLAEESVKLLYSQDFAMLYKCDHSQPILNSFQFLFNEILTRNTRLSSDIIKASEIMSGRPGPETTLSAVLHPLVENVIARELLTVKPPPVNSFQERHSTSYLPTKARDVSELWSRIITCWECALNSEYSRICPQKEPVSTTVPEDLSQKTVLFLQNTASLMKLTRNVMAIMSKQRRDTHLYFDLTQLQKWTDVAVSALSSMSLLKSAEKHQLFIVILDTITYLDSCSWFNMKLSAKFLNTFISIAGWPWLNEFGSHIPQRLKPFPPFARSFDNLEFIKSSEILISKSVRALRLEIFRPWKHFVLKVYCSLMNAAATFENVSLLVDLLSAISEVTWPFKEMPLGNTFSFLCGIVQRDIWKVEPCVRWAIGCAITALPCVCCYSLQAVRQPGKQDLPLGSGCQNCSSGKYQEGGVIELEQKYAVKIVSIASPILQSPFLRVKFRLTEVISRCNNHMKNPSAILVMPLLNVAVNGKANICEEIFRKCGTLLTENSNTNLETGCPLRLEVAQRIFRVTLPQVCRKLLQAKKRSKLPLTTRMKILFSIQELSLVGSISLAVFVEIVNFMLLILCQTGNNDMGVVLLCQKIVTSFAETQKCAPHELITRVRSQICRQLVKVSVKRFYHPFGGEESKMEECSRYIEMLKSIGSFSFRNTFAKYYYPCLMEQIVPNLHSNESYQFLLSAFSNHADDTTTMMLQETVIVWYPTLLLDHSSEVVSQCLKFLLQQYKFDAVFVAKQQEQRILNEALCRLNERKDKILRFLSHLCKWDDTSSQQLLSQGTSKSLNRSEIQELLDKRMLGFFLHLDTKVKSRIETVEMKKRTLRSFVALISLMGKSKMTPLRSKAYQTLNSVTEQGPVFYDVMYEAWKAFAANLDSESFAAMTCPILAAILPLRENPSMRSNVDGLVSHFVCFKKEVTSVHHPKLYFLLDQCDDQEVKVIINAAVSAVKVERWFDYFNMLVEEAGHSNSHIRYQAFRKLNNVFDQEAASVEKFVFAKGQRNVSRLISTLLDGLRGAAGGKPDDDKMRLVIAKCFGNLGALDPFRFRNGDDERCSRKSTGVVVSAQISTFCLFYVQELIREFRDAKDATIFDYCVCLIRNLFQDFSVKMTDDDFIWKNLSRENQEIITPMLTTKYVLDVEENLPDFDCPIYLSEYGKNFDDWLLNWLTVLIRCITTHENKAYSLFVKNMYLLRKNARIAAFIIPCVALHAVFCASDHQLFCIITEMKNILERWTILEKRKVQNSIQVIKDSEADMDIFEEPMSVENESVFHCRCTQIIFSILDHLLRSLRLAQRKAAIKRGKERSGRPDSSGEMMTQVNMDKVERVLDQIPALLMSQVAFDSQSGATALFYIEQELKKQPSKGKLQRHLDYLQRIYVSLNDMDSVLGISAVRDGEPSCHERVLENIAEGKVEDYMKNIELMTKDSSSLIVNYALVQAYLSVDEPSKAQNNVLGILAKHPEWEVAFQDVQIGSLVKLKSWDGLKTEVNHLESFCGNPILEEKGLSWNIAISRTLSNLHSHQFDKAEEIVDTLRERLVAPLVAASEEMHPYKRAYDYIVQLHILAEVEEAIGTMRRHSILMSSNREKFSQVALYKDVKAMVGNWDSRLINVSKSRKTLDQILNVRKSVFEIMKVTFQTSGQLCEILNSSIRECWLDIAKDSSRCANFIRADNALLEAKQFMSPKVFIQEAKILARKNNKDNAVSVLQKGINKYFPNLEAWKHQSHKGYSSQMMESLILCSKSLLLLAKLCEEQKLLDKQDYIDKYKEASDVYKESEKNFFTLGSYFDRLWSREKGNCDLQVKVCHYYSHSLLYGCKYVYQSLPRLLSIWFDHAASVKYGDANKSAAVTRVNGSSSSPAVLSPVDALSNMENSIKSMVGNVPPYVLMTAFSQLVSRLCHSHVPTWAILKSIIVLIIRSHPYQTLWMTMAVNNSVNPTRRKRCVEIYRSVENATPNLKNTIKDYTNLTDKFLGLCDKQISKDVSKASLVKIYDKLPKLIRGMGKVLIPFQIFMNPSLPQKGFSHKDHDPYPEPPVYISNIEDTVDIMSSLIRPKKITLIASNGKRYGLLCKPKDDLRKDSKVMEVNNVVNWYLRQNTESSDRRLHVKAYSVVPLNEECGLLEWVPNLQALRLILLALYKEKEITLPRGPQCVINKLDSQDQKKQKFQRMFLDSTPPVLSEWFFNNFSDHQSWYAARMSYTRTAAVMSIVGYIMGLGDRHGENLLLDTVTGEVQHVDFNCLFNKGEALEYPEMVPFRLTQNMVDAMGPLKYEGVFRRSCEIAMKMFRDHQNVFLSVFRPFVYDPLVEWQKYTRGFTASLENGEMTNEKAVDTMNYIRYRLNGTARNKMKDIDTELSVEAQVKFLIEEATSIENLCQMYFGWAAHL